MKILTAISQALGAADKSKPNGDNEPADCAKVKTELEEIKQRYRVARAEAFAYVGTVTNRNDSDSSMGSNRS